MNEPEKRSSDLRPTEETRDADCGPGYVRGFPFLEDGYKRPVEDNLCTQRISCLPASRTIKERMLVKLSLIWLTVQVLAIHGMRHNSAETRYVPSHESAAMGRSFSHLGRASQYSIPTENRQSSFRSSPAFQPYVSDQYLYKKSSPKEDYMSVPIEEDLNHGIEEMMSPEEDPTEQIQHISDCMHVVNNEESTWRFVSSGSKQACGLYVVSDPQYLVELTLDNVDVDCNNGLVMLFDGWELNGKTFPIPEDHQLPMKGRSHYFCKASKGRKTVLMHQNAGLVSYKVPVAGEGFTVSVKFIKNPEPCNILMSDTVGMFKMTNNGNPRNCSLTTLLFPANMQVLNINVGNPDRQRRNNKEWIETKCSQLGSEDFVEVGGASELDSSNLLASETLCGYESRPARKSMTVLCDSSTVRLVSSGRYHNYVTIFVKAAGEEDLDFEKSLILACPGMF